MYEPLHVYGHGKLLITGEYAIMKGAKGLAVPVRFKQHLRVKPLAEPLIRWTSRHPDKSLWMQAEYDLNLKMLSGTPSNDAGLIRNILLALKKLNPDLFRRGHVLETHTEFSRDWGMGTSSSLIAVLSKWAQVNPFELLDQTFGGSGFDVAVSLGGKQMLFWREGHRRKWEFVRWRPPFGKNIFFVHLNRKQDTARVVKKFATRPVPDQTIARITRLSEEMLETKQIGRFQELMLEHEHLVGKLIGQRPVGKRLFADFDGTVKSLGAWGGDMVMAVGGNDSEQYFRSRGYEIIFPFSKLMI